MLQKQWMFSCFICFSDILDAFTCFSTVVSLAKDFNLESTQQFLSPLDMPHFETKVIYLIRHLKFYNTFIALL